MISKIPPWSLLLFCLVSCGGQTPSPLVNRPSLSSIAEADPAVDAMNAIDHGDMRLAAIREYAVIVPGLPDNKIVSEHPEQIWIIEGTSDTGDPVLNDLAREYAERYNGFILGHKSGAGS